MEIKKIKLKDIEFSPFQYKLQDEKTMLKLRKSLELVGLVAPLVVYEKAGKYILVDGNHRLAELKKNNVKETEALVINADDKLAKLYAVLINENIFNIDIGLLDKFLIDDDELKNLLDFKFLIKETKKDKEREIIEKPKGDKVSYVLYLSPQVYEIYHQKFGDINNSDEIVKQILRDYAKAKATGNTKES